MAAEETLELQRLIHLMLENLTSLLGSLAALQIEKSLEGMTSLDDLIPSLRKIRKLAELLDYALKSNHYSLGNRRTAKWWLYMVRGRRFHQSNFSRLTFAERLLIEGTWQLLNTPFILIEFFTKAWCSVFTLEF